MGLINNAGTSDMHATTNAQGWDTTFATDHLGPFMLTEILMPYLPNDSNVIFICSGVEDPQRRYALEQLSSWSACTCSTAQPSFFEATSPITSKRTVLPVPRLPRSARQQRGCSGPTSNTRATSSIRASRPATTGGRLRNRGCREEPALC